MIKDVNELQTNVPTENLFQEEELVSEEEKKYNEFSNKRDMELLEHLNHLKINHDDEPNEEEEKNHDILQNR